MRVYFFDKHTGIMGAGVPLPEIADMIASRWEGTTGDPEELIRELQEAFPTGKVGDTPIGHVDLMGKVRDTGMISLIFPATGYPRHCWRVICYKYPDESSPETPKGV